MPVPPCPHGTVSGKSYYIAESVYQYAPKRTQEGLLYDMDRIYAVLQDGVPILFLDQEANGLDLRDIYP